jgi:hypothetical protein
VPFADDTAVPPFVSSDLHQEIAQVVRYCKERDMKCNLSKSEMTVFKKGGRLKNT